MNNTRGQKTNSSTKTGQSFQAPTVSSLPLNNMFKIVSVVQQGLTEVSDAEPEEARTMTITKLVTYIMKQNGDMEFIGPSKS
jgi:hypothetical protein